MQEISQAKTAWPSGKDFKKGGRCSVEEEDWIWGLLWGYPSKFLESQNERMLEMKETLDNTLMFLSFKDEKLQCRS